MPSKTWVQSLFALALLGVAANAHHSTAAYDLKRDVIVEGTVQEYHWVNPHSWVKVQTVDADGAQQVWNIECGTPSTSIRMGWTPSTLKAGDKAKFVIHPRIDGEVNGVLAMLIFPDGKTLPGMTQPAGPIPGVTSKP